LSYRRKSRKTVANDIIKAKNDPACIELDEFFRPHSWSQKESNGLPSLRGRFEQSGLEGFWSPADCAVASALVLLDFEVDVVADFTLIGGCSNGVDGVGVGEEMAEVSVSNPPLETSVDKRVMVF
jgi:hypothetical protein